MFYSDRVVADQTLRSLEATLHIGHDNCFAAISSMLKCVSHELPQTLCDIVRVLGKQENFSLLIQELVDNEQWAQQVADRSYLHDNGFFKFDKVLFRTI